MFRSIVAFGLMIISSCWFLSQSDVSAQVFDVASIKPSDPKLRKPISIRSSGGRLTITSYNLKMLIRTAYDLEEFRIAGGPSWIDADAYDIVAGSDQSPTEEQRLIMLRKLLKDRFQLKHHRESKVLTVYELGVARKGFKLKAAEEGAELWWRYGGGQIESRNMSMPWLAQALTRYIKQTVVDKTELMGGYDFKLEWDESAELASAADTLRPSLFTAVQEQLGLKLTAAKGIVEVLVIDHVVRPSEN
jgi:uncharacterized protein (TIGR03435 family)